MKLQANTCNYSLYETRTHLHMHAVVSDTKQTFMWTALPKI